MIIFDGKNKIYKLYVKATVSHVVRESVVDVTMADR